MSGRDALSVCVWSSVPSGCCSLPWLTPYFSIFLFVSLADVVECAALLEALPSQQPSRPTYLRSRLVLIPRYFSTIFHDILTLAALVQKFRCSINSDQEYLIS